MATQFNPATLGPNLTLSNSNKTVARTGAAPTGYARARSDVSVTSGKYQFVIHVDSFGGGYVIFGVLRTSDPTYGSTPAYQAQVGFVDLVACIDADARKIYLGYNNTGSSIAWFGGTGAPGTGPGIAIPGTDGIHIGVAFTANGSATMRTLQSEWPVGLVSGYLAWDSLEVKSYPPPASMSWDAQSPIVTNPVQVAGFDWASLSAITSLVVPENYFGFDNPPASQAIGANVPTADMGWGDPTPTIPAMPPTANMGWTAPSLAVPLYAPAIDMGWIVPALTLPATPSPGDMSWSAPEPYVGMVSYVAVPADFGWEVLEVRATSREALNDFWFFSDNPTAQLHLAIRDEWGWKDAPTLSTVSSLSVPDPWSWAESPLVVEVLAVSDTWSWSDSPAARIILTPVSTQDAWTWSDSPSPSSLLSAVVSDLWRWSESPADAYRVSLPDTWGFSDSPAARIILTPVSTQDAWAWSETPALNVSLAESVVDAWGWQDAPIARLSLSIGVDDVWVWQDSLSTGQASIYSVNLDTGAVSRYVLPKSILSAAWHRGKLYLATSTGLHVLDGSTDNGVPIRWKFKTGMLDFGTDLLKRVVDINVSCRATGDIAAKVVTDRAGTKREDLFILTRQTREATRDGVIKIGRGLVSSCWQIGLSGVGPAEISEIRAVVEPLSRRR